MRPENGGVNRCAKGITGRTRIVFHDRDGFVIKGRRYDEERHGLRTLSVLQPFEIDLVKDLEEDIGRKENVTT